MENGSNCSMKFCGPPRETSRKLFKCVAESLYVSNAVINQHNSGTIGELVALSVKFQRSSVCSLGASSLVGTVGVQFVINQLAIIVSL